MVAPVFRILTSNPSKLNQNIGQPFRLAHGHPLEARSLHPRKVVHLLLQGKADTGKNNFLGEAPLHSAAIRNQHEIVRGSVRCSLTEQRRPFCVWFGWTHTDRTEHRCPGFSLFLIIYQYHLCLQRGTYAHDAHRSMELTAC